MKSRWFEYPLCPNTITLGEPPLSNAPVTTSVDAAAPPVNEGTQGAHGVLLYFCSGRRKRPGSKLAGMALEHNRAKIVEASA